MCSSVHRFVFIRARIYKHRYVPPKIGRSLWNYPISCESEKHVIHVSCILETRIVCQTELAIENHVLTRRNDKYQFWGNLDRFRTINLDWSSLAFDLRDSQLSIFFETVTSDPLTSEQIVKRRDARTRKDDTRNDVVWRDSGLIKSRCFTVSAGRAGRSRSVGR